MVINWCQYQTISCLNKKKEIRKSLLKNTTLYLSLEMAAYGWLLLSKKIALR